MLLLFRRHYDDRHDEYLLIFLIQVEKLVIFQTLVNWCLWMDSLPTKILGIGNGRKKEQRRQSEEDRTKKVKTLKHLLTSCGLSLTANNYFTSL